MSFASNGESLISSSDDDSIVIYDTMDGKLVIFVFFMNAARTHTVRNARICTVFSYFSFVFINTFQFSRFFLCFKQLPFYFFLFIIGQKGHCTARSTEWPRFSLHTLQTPLSIHRQKWMVRLLIFLQILLTNKPREWGTELWYLTNET